MSKGNRMCEIDIVIGALGYAHENGITLEEILLLLDGSRVRDADDFDAMIGAAAKILDLRQNG